MNPVRLSVPIEEADALRRGVEQGVPSEVQSGAGSVFWSKHVGTAGMVQPYAMTIRGERKGIWSQLNDGAAVVQHVFDAIGVAVHCDFCGEKRFE